MTSFNSQSEKLLHDLLSQSRTDLHDKLENINENKTSQINHILLQINRTSDDLFNLHLKIGNITSSLNKLDEIKQDLLQKSEKIIFNFKNIYKENEATRQMLKNISDIRSETEHRQVLESIEVLHQYLGQS